MQRPIGVTITAILMVFNAFADIVISVVAPHATAPNPHSGGPVFTPVVIAVHVALITCMALGFFTVWSYWRGRPWARWLVLAGCIYYLTGIRFLPSQFHRSPFGAALTIFSVALSLFLIGYLYTLDVRIWFSQPPAASATEK
jgi:hypothetical protein